MSDRELEMQEDDNLVNEEEVTLEAADSELEEARSRKVKESDIDDDDTGSDPQGASFGDPSDSGDVTTKKTDEKPKGKGDPMPKTKIGMINAMVDAMKGHKKDEIAASYEKMMAALDLNEDDDEEEAEESKKNVKEVKKNVKEVKKVTKEDIDVSDDVRALFGEEDLSEEFKESATTIFEAAVVSKINEVLDSVSVDMDAELEAEKHDAVQPLNTRLDDYLEYVVEEWTKENQIAIESGIRAEIVENFMEGLRGLFTENYVDIPEEKVDLVDELAAKVQELEASVNEEMEKNIDISKQLQEIKKEQIIENISDGLSENQSDKLKSLADGVDFEDEEDYTKKLETIKENYFPSEEVVSEIADDDEPLEIEDDDKNVNGSMANYMNAISRSIKK